MSSTRYPQERTLEGHPRAPVPLDYYVRGAIFPATRDDLVTRAKENNAPEGVILAVASLPQEWFDTMDDVRDASEALGEE